MLVGAGQSRWRFGDWPPLKLPHLFLPQIGMGSWRLTVTSSTTRRNPSSNCGILNTDSPSPVPLNLTTRNGGLPILTMTTTFSHIGLVCHEDAQDPAEISQPPNSATIAEPLLDACAELSSLPDTTTHWGQRGCYPAGKLRVF